MSTTSFVRLVGSIGVTERPTILVIAEDDSLRRLLAIFLRSEGF